MPVLRGTIAVVTEAGNNGIGWGLCKHAAGRLSMHVVAVDLHESLVRAAETRLREQFPHVESLGVAADVTKPEDLARCLQTIQRELPADGQGRCLRPLACCSSARCCAAPFRSGRPPCRSNVIGVVNTIQTFVPVLRDRTSPRYSVGAGVSAVGRTVHGTPHGCDLAMPDLTPEVFGETLRSLAGFARSL